MTTYCRADDDTVRLLNDTMEKHHARLVDAGVRVSAVMAIAKLDKDGNPVGPALKHHGVPALAKVRIIPHKDRVQGMADAEVIIDGDRWTFLAIPERVAILDHELTHLVLVEGEDDVVRDDGGRPKLKMRHHDHEFGWFTEVAERHGKHSQERQQAQTLFDGAGQAYFAFLAVAKAA